MSIVNATNFRKEMFKYLDNAIQAGDVVTVTTKEGNAVVISEEEYNNLVETAYLNAIPGLADSLIEAREADDSEFSEVDWKSELQD